MSQVEIGAKISVDAGSAASSINDLQNNLKKAKEELNSAAIGSKEYAEAQKNVKDATDKLNTAQKSSSGAFGDLKDKLAQTIPGLKGAESGVLSLGKQLLVLATNPVVLILTAIVAALKFLYDAFVSTDEGAQKVTAVLDGLGSVLRELYTRALGLGKALFDLFTGDFKGAFEEGKKLVTGFGDAMVDAFNRGKEASNALDDVEDKLRQLDLVHAAMNAKLAKSKELMSDENASYKDKKKALQESGEEIDKYYGKYSKLMDQNVDAIAKKYNVEKEVNELRNKGVQEGAAAFDEALQKMTIGKEGMQEVENAIKESINAQAEYSAKQRAQDRLEKSLNKQHNAEVKQDLTERNRIKKEKADEEAKINENRINQNKHTDELILNNEIASMKEGIYKKLFQLEVSMQNEIDKEADAYNKKLINKEQYEKNVALITARYKAEQKRIEDEEKKKQELEDKKKEQQDAKDKLAKSKEKISDTTLKIAERRAELDAMDKLLKEYRDKGLITEQEYTKGIDDNVKARKAIDKAEVDGKIALGEAYASALNGVADVVGKNTVAGKGLSLASALINTYEAITKANNMPFPSNIPAVISAAATGFGAVKNILATPIPGKGSGGGSVPSNVSTSAPLIPRQALSTTSLSGRTLQSMNANASRAYVVESDITNGQTRMTRINRAARLG